MAYPLRTKNRRNRHKFEIPGRLGVTLHQLQRFLYSSVARASGKITRGNRLRRSYDSTVAGIDEFSKMDVQNRTHCTGSQEI